MVKLSINEETRIGAESMKQMFDEFIRVGFTEDQTIKIITGMATANRKEK